MKHSDIVDAAVRKHRCEATHYTLASIVSDARRSGLADCRVIRNDATILFGAIAIGDDHEQICVRDMSYISLYY